MVTGANGFLGQYLVRDLLRDGHTVYALGKGPARIGIPQENLSYFSLDLTQPESCTALLESLGSADVMIHAAALTQVDYCEAHRDETFRVNVEGTRVIAALAKRYCRQLVFISTDFVFDGGQGNYAEDDPAAPVNYYGLSKLQAEQIIRETPMPWTIIRTCLVYGNPLTGTRSNIIAWVKENLEQGKPIKVVADQVRTPTYVEDLSRGIVLALEHQAQGVFHLSGNEILTPYEMALQVAAYFHLNPALIEKVDAATFTQTGQRPLKTGFTISRAIRELGFAPRSFQEAMRQMYGEKG